MELPKCQGCGKPAKSGYEILKFNHEYVWMRMFIMRNQYYPPHKTKGSYGLYHFNCGNKIITKFPSGTKWYDREGGR